MNCPECNKPLREGAVFCTQCGTRTAHGRDSLSDSLPTAESGVEGAKGGVDAEDALVGRLLDGKYEVVERLGEGGMGSVYRARRVHIGDEVAVKVLHSRFVNDETLVERFRREARAAAQLKHPNIVTIHDYGEARGAEGFAYIVMELVRGISLRELLRREGRLGVERAVALMLDVCAGVSVAHRRDIVHRDVKPDNIIVMPPDADHERERVKVVDFGIAKLRDMAGDSALTQAGAMVGTPFYMSPEQCRGENLDARADVYSLGALFYEMLAGQPPFTAPTVTGVISKHLTEPPPPLPENLNVAPALQTLIARALAKDPAGRQNDASEFARDVRAAATGGDARTRISTPAPVFPPVPEQQAFHVDAQRPSAMTGGVHPAVHTHSQHAAQHTLPPTSQPQTFDAPPRRKSRAPLYVALFVVASLGAMFVLILLGLFYLGSQENVGNENVSPASKPARTTANESSANEAAPAASRFEEAERKIVSGESLAEGDLEGASPEQLRLLRNMIFARHGRSFESEELQKYFESRAWYRPDGGYDESRLTPADYSNAELIKRLGGEAEATKTDAAKAAKEVGEVVAAWAAAANERDLDAHMKHYAEVLETFYRKSGVPASQVRAERARAFSRYEDIEVSVDNLKVELDGSGGRARATFDKTWEFESENRSSKGSVQQALTLVKGDGRWLITGERDLKVYYADSEDY